MNPVIKAIVSFVQVGIFGKNRRVRVNIPAFFLQFYNWLAVCLKKKKIQQNYCFDWLCRQEKIFCVDS